MKYLFLISLEEHLLKSPIEKNTECLKVGLQFYNIPELVLILGKGSKFPVTQIITYIYIMTTNQISILITSVILQIYI